MPSELRFYVTDMSVTLTAVRLMRGGGAGVGFRPRVDQSSIPCGPASPRRARGRARRSGGPRNGWSSRPAKRVSRRKGRSNGGDGLAQVFDCGEVAGGRLAPLDPELARVGRLGADHVADQLVPVPAAAARALAQLGR